MFFTEVPKKHKSQKKNTRLKFYRNLKISLLKTLLKKKMRHKGKIFAKSITDLKNNSYNSIIIPIEYRQKFEQERHTIHTQFSNKHMKGGSILWVIGNSDSTTRRFHIH